MNENNPMITIRDHEAKLAEHDKQLAKMFDAIVELKAQHDQLDNDVSRIVEVHADTFNDLRAQHNELKVGVANISKKLAE
jgi:hypothetical protein